MALEFVMHANGNNLIVLINIAGSSRLIKLNSTPKIVVIQPSINAQTVKLPKYPACIALESGIHTGEVYTTPYFPKG